MCVCLYKKKKNDARVFFFIVEEKVTKDFRRDEKNAILGNDLKSLMRHYVSYSVKKWFLFFTYFFYNRRFTYIFLFLLIE